MESEEHVSEVRQFSRLHMPDPYTPLGGCPLDGAPLTPEFDNEGVYEPRIHSLSLVALCKTELVLAT